MYVSEARETLAILAFVDVLMISLKEHCGMPIAIGTYYSRRLLKFSRRFDWMLGH